MLRLYLIFLWDAVKVAAVSVVVVVVAIAAFNKLGVDPLMTSTMSWPLAFFAFIFLAQRYVGRNLGWILGLPKRKLSLAWFNFGLNLSLLALVIVASGAVIVATYVLFPNAPARVLVPDLATIPSWSLPHGRALAIVVFFVTTMLLTCWSVIRQPDAAEQARRKRSMALRMLIVLMVIPLTFGFAFRPTSQRDAVSPLLLFAAGMLFVCISMPYWTAKSLGTSVRQRRIWMLVGAAIAFAGVGTLVAVASFDLRSPDPSIRREAAKLLGSLAETTGQRDDLLTTGPLEGPPNDHGRFR